MIVKPDRSPFLIIVSYDGNFQYNYKTLIIFLLCVFGNYSFNFRTHFFTQDDKREREKQYVFLSTDRWRLCLLL